MMTTSPVQFGCSMCVFTRSINKVSHHNNHNDQLSLQCIEEFLPHLNYYYCSNFLFFPATFSLSLCVHVGFFPYFIAYTHTIHIISQNWQYIWAGRQGSCCCCDCIDNKPKEEKKLVQSGWLISD